MADRMAGRQTLKIMGKAFHPKINELIFVIKGLSHSSHPLRGNEITMKLDILSLFGQARY
jgi:hypothetical protein